MLTAKERRAIQRLWGRKLEQDAQGLPHSRRHRNLEPASAEFIASLAAGLGAVQLLEIGGSSGLSTIALAAAVRATGGRLTSIEIEPERQAEAKETLNALGLDTYVDFVLGDAATVLPGLEAMGFVLIDCEKDDYVRFFDMLNLTPGAVVVADNVISHRIDAYITYVRAHPHTESITLPLGKGLEITRLV
jgi:predicted O-methyltransferase YrrM